ncbi:YrrS family protein [Metabacillus idriensis]|uniref:YrrS family protein n=1 Tax=Metabacillus idriensis TaxID=324768 RepID=UPI0028142C38|nr:YrrS family protein [Metabacillus idriensis]MDR0138264.1 YrrS family protein [Metabacillus idriensis]
MHLSKLSKGSRFENRDKRRKANVVLNILIGIVVILILVIGSQLMLGGNDSEQASKGTKEETGSNQIENEKNKEEKDKEQTAKEDAESEQDSSEEADAAEEDENAKEEPEESEAGEEEVVTEGDPNSNVDQIIENPGWKPVGTSQSEPHAAQYDKDSQDWAEMIQAMSYATGLSESDMTIWFIGNNGSPNDAKGTISSKDKTQNYKVEITWVENEGWKPVKVEKLKQTETR